MENKSAKSVSYSLDKPYVYTPELFGFKNIEGTGKGIKITLIDSGVPEHKLLVPCKSWINATSSSNHFDTIGHSTMISGVINSNNPSILQGIAYDATLCHVKTIDENSKLGFDGLITGILWSIIQEVDIVLIAISSPINNNAFYDVIKKAYQNNICIVSAAGNENKLEYPAIYDEVLSVGALNKDGNIEYYSASGKVNIQANNLPTTYLQQAYAYASGTSIASALVTGLLSRVIEKETFSTPKEYYAKLMEYKL